MGTLAHPFYIIGMEPTRRLAIAGAALCALLLPVFAAARTIVSLTFDDGTSDHVAASQVLNQRGLKATFFINSSEIGTSGFYMTVSDLRALQNAGHEIGGHTLDHADLTSVSTSAVLHEVCDDRAALTGMGLNATAFDYPFGKYNDAVVATVRSCGYTNARSLGGIGCPGCASAESEPPADLFAIRTPALVSSATALGDLEALVIAAEQAGGGWLPIVIHRVCDGCAANSTSLADLTSFADFLAARAGIGTVVQTIGQAAAGIAPVNPAPSAARLSPAGGAAGALTLEVAVLGSNFINGSSVMWNGSALTTSYVDAGQLRATLRASDMAAPGTAAITVFTPGPGGGTSAALTFTVAVAAAPPADAANAAFQFHDAYAFPNPSRRGRPVTVRFQGGVADTVSVRIFDLSGAPVNDGSPGSPRVIDDGNGKGLQFTYEYRWDVSGAGSGVYVYTITAKKAGHPDIRQLGRVGVLK